MKKDLAETVLTIKGAMAQNTTSNISTILFQNYDNDVAKLYNMASIAMYDSFGDSNSNGFGSLKISTANGSNNLMPWLYIKHNGNVGINTSNPTTNLDVNGTIKATSLQGNGANITGLSLSNVSLGVLQVPQGGTGLSNITQDAIIIGNSLNTLNTTSNLTFNTTTNTLTIHSDK